MDDIRPDYDRFFVFLVFFLRATDRAFIDGHHVWHGHIHEHIHEHKRFCAN